MTQHFQHALVAVGAIVTFAYGQLLPHLFAERMPQVPGENVVAMLLGDARQEISFALLEKADDYFHGGVRHAECDHSLSSASQKESEHHSPTEGRHAHAHGHDHDHDHHEHDAASAPLDPWRWINRRVHVQEHRHTEGEDARELVPWLWAACRTSPRNIQAYESSAYVLSQCWSDHDAWRCWKRASPQSTSAGQVSLGQLALHSLATQPARNGRSRRLTRSASRSPAEM